MYLGHKQKVSSPFTFSVSASSVLWQDLSPVCGCDWLIHSSLIFLASAWETDIRRSGDAAGRQPVGRDKKAFRTPADDRQLTPFTIQTNSNLMVALHSQVVAAPQWWRCSGESKLPSGPHKLTSPSYPATTKYVLSPKRTITDAGSKRELQQSSWWSWKLCPTDVDGEH